MNRFHVNPKTGLFSICKAETDGGCPFGSEFHGSSPHEVREIYENYMEKSREGKGFLGKLFSRGGDKAVVREAREILQVYRMAMNDLPNGRDGGVMGIEVSANEEAAFYHYINGYDFNADKNSWDGKDPYAHPIVMARSRKLIDGVFKRARKNPGAKKRSFVAVSSDSWKGDFQTDVVDKLQFNQDFNFNGYITSEKNEERALRVVDSKATKTVIFELEGYCGVEVDMQPSDILYSKENRWKVSGVKEFPNGLTKVLLRENIDK